MRPITSEEKQQFSNRLVQELSIEGSLSTTLSIIEELKKLAIDPRSLDDELIQEIRSELIYVKNMLDLCMQSKDTQLTLLPAEILHPQTCKGLELFNDWLKGDLGPSKQPEYSESNPRQTGNRPLTYFPQPEPPLSNTINSARKITKDKLKDILDGNNGHSGYHTKSWFYYFFGYFFGLSPRRSGTIVVLFELLNQNKEQFEEIDIKNAIYSAKINDQEAPRRLSLFQGYSKKNGSSTDDILEELRMAFKA